ncbi:MAG: cation transporting ATPase C-terminal domain-containing protein [Thermodesulfovibrio sp.]|nr:cation transporting ATPase C-terminal domain-containing protein [Thermodesulfovibrio sp.]
MTNGLKVIALPFEQQKKRIINRPQKPPQEGIMSRLIIERTIIVSLLISLGVAYTFMHSLKQRESLETPRTVAVTTMVLPQFFQAYNSRYEYESILIINPFSNMFLFLGIMVSTLAQLAFIYIPVLQWVFRTEPISVSDWQNIILVAISVIIVVEVDKWLRRRNRK